MKKSIPTWLFILVTILAVFLGGLHSWHKERELRHSNKTIDTILTLCKDDIAVAEAIRVTFDVTQPEAEAYTQVFKRWNNKGVIKWQTLAGLVWVESNYNPSVVSKKGAVGLLQTMPDTWKMIAKRRKDQYGRTTPTRDIVLLDYGCEFAHDMVKQWGYPKGLGIYNVGSDTFQISQQVFIDSVQKYERKIDLIYKGLSK